MNCVTISHPSTAYSRRVKLWGETRGEIPAGMVVDVNCGNRLCWCSEHLELRPRIVHDKYTAIKERLHVLPIDDYFDLPEVNGTKQQIISWRCGLNAVCGLDKFILRQLPNGGVRIIKRGNWAGYDNPISVESTRGYLILKTRKPMYKRPAQLWLGRSYGELEGIEIVHPKSCKIPACPMPLLYGSGDYCHHHNHFFDYKESMTDRALDPGSFFNPREPHQGYELVNDVRPAATWALENSLSFVGPTGTFDSRHKSSTEKPTKFVSVESGRFKMRRGGGSHSSSKTTAGRRRSAARNGPGSRHSTKEKRWTRDTIDSLEKQADALLVEAFGPEADEMRFKQEMELRDQLAEYEHEDMLGIFGVEDVGETSAGNG